METRSIEVKIKQTLEDVFVNQTFFESLLRIVCH